MFTMPGLMCLPAPNGLLLCFSIDGGGANFLHESHILLKCSSIRSLTDFFNSDESNPGMINVGSCSCVIPKYFRKTVVNKRSSIVL